MEPPGPAESWQAQKYLEETAGQGAKGSRSERCRKPSSRQKKVEKSCQRPMLPPSGVKTADDDDDFTDIFSMTLKYQETFPTTSSCTTLCLIYTILSKYILFQPFLEHFLLEQFLLGQVQFCLMLIIRKGLVIYIFQYCKLLKVIKNILKLIS